jgi:hypothetical protein
MTEPQDSQDTRPISVAELLARNGTIGSPPVGGRRRRRRGNADAVTVAELTGEIPVVTEEHFAAHAPSNGSADTVAEPEIEPDAELDLEPQVDHETEPEATDSAAPDIADDLAAPEVSAEEMAPDQLDLDDDDTAAALDEPADHVDELPSYLHASPERLFGGRTAHDDYRADAATLSAIPTVPPQTTTAEDHEEAEPLTRAQQLARGALIVAQSILAVAFGAGLFIAFDQLWDWNKVIALVLSVLVILGLVAAVWVVRKTEDIASTLIAVAVGALVTMGPLVLHTN